MSLKALGEIAAESNDFDAALKAALAAGEIQKWDSRGLISWLRDCVAHGRYLPSGSPEREALQALVDYWTSRLLQLDQAGSDDIDRLADFNPTAGVPLIVECPYAGLEPYSQGQRASFFGREELIRECVAHLEDAARRIFLIIGASGSGKSSLALAGVLPEIEKRHHSEWLIAPPFTPGSEPLIALATSIAQAVGQTDGTDAVVRMLAGNRLRELAELCHGKPLVLLVDQFEELFTLCRDVGTQKMFGQLLTALSAPDGVDGTSASRILLTLRTDHLARLESNDALQPLHVRLIGEGNHHYLSAIGFADIHRAIAEPAKQVGLRFVPAALINRLASQTAGMVSGLPLLQFALRRLWDTRPRDSVGQPLDLVTAEMVDALPDVQRALGTVADELFQQFTPSQQQICERLLQELVVLDENFEEPLRRRRDEAELTRVLVARRNGTTADVAAIITQFVAAGLLRQFGEGLLRQIEVAHEALLRHWKHINRLVTGQEVKERLHLVKQIGREAAEWVTRSHPEGYLNLRGERLQRALEYRQEDWLVEAESAEYVEACRLREETDKEREAQRLAAEKAAERAEGHRKIWKRVALAVTPLLLVIFFFTLSLQRSGQRMRAEQQRALGLGLAGASVWQQLEQPSRLEESVLYAVASARALKEPNLGQIHALQQGLYLLPKRSWRLDHRGMVWRVAFNGRLVATVSEDKTVRVFDVSDTSGKPVKELAHQQDLWTVAFSSTGEYLATGGAGGARLFETQQWTEVWQQPFEDPTASLSFARDGRTLALGNLYSVAAVAVKSGTELWRTSTPYTAIVWDVAFSPDGRRVAVATDDPRAGVLDARSGAVVRAFGRAVRAVAFSEDGRSLVIGSGNEARVLRIDSGRSIGPDLQHAGTVLTVACSRDCRYVVTGSADNAARVFDVESGRQISALAHRGAVNAVGLSSDGRWVATGSSDGTARVFGALDGRETLRFSNDEEREVAVVAFSPSGKYVTTGSAIFEAANGYEVARVPAPSGVNQMALSADGDYLATISDKAFAAGESGTVRVTDLKTGRPLGPLLGSRDKYIAVSDGGRYVAAANEAGVDIIDVATRESTLKRDYPSSKVAAVDLSPDARFVVVGEERTVHLVDTSTGKPPWTIPPFLEPVSVVVFSYDGQYFAVGSKEPRVRVFSVATGKPLAALADGLPHEFVGARCKPPSQLCQVSALSFSRDGKHIATASDDRTARVFDLVSGREEARFPHVGPVVYATFTRQDARYLATSSNDYIGRVFDVATKKAVWHLPLRDGDFFPLQFTERDKYVLRALSIADEVVVERHLWRLEDMLDNACSIVSRDLAPEEWRPYSDIPLQACPRSSDRSR